MIVYLQSTREIDGHCIMCRKHRAVNTGRRSLKQLVMEEELLTEVLTVASLAFWFVLLLLKLDEVLALFGFWLAPFRFWLAPFGFWLVPFWFWLVPFTF